MTVRTMVIEEHGGPEKFKMVEEELGQPGPGQVMIRHKAVGLNFIDVYQRTGLYPMALPHALGMEAAGVIEAVGEGVTHLKAGDRAAYAATPPGAYCGRRKAITTVRWLFCRRAIQARTPCKSALRFWASLFFITTK